MSATKSGIVFIDVAWHRRTGERYGFPPSDEPEIEACWNVEDEAKPAHPFVEAGFGDVDEAVRLARQRAPVVLVRLGPTEDVMFSAGEQRATRELAEFGGTDLTPYPEWQPDDRERHPQLLLAIVDVSRQRRWFTRETKEGRDHPALPSLPF